MCQRGKGVIINIAGLAGERPDAYYIAGSCANAALIMFSRSLGGDSIRHGVRVLAVNPGPVETEKHINDTKRLAKEKFGDENRWRDVMSGLPMKRAATTDEVSGMVAFLCSDLASYISGSSITDRRRAADRFRDRREAGLEDDVANEMFLTVSGKFLVTEINIEIPPGRVMGELGFLSPKNHRTSRSNVSRMARC